MIAEHITYGEDPGDTRLHHAIYLNTTCSSGRQLAIQEVSDRLPALQIDEDTRYWQHLSLAIVRGQPDTLDPFLSYHLSEASSQVNVHSRMLADLSRQVRRCLQFRRLHQ